MTRLAILVACLVAFCSRGQGTLPPCGFWWEPPAIMDGIVGYRLQWGPQDAAEVPLHQTAYQVEALAAGLNLPVSVYSLSTTTNSVPTTIHVYNVTALIEESDDLTNWSTIGSVLLRGQRKPTSFLRINLQAAP